MPSAMPPAPPLEITPADLENEVRAYREARVARLTSEKGWLTLIGKVWLRPGRHRIGSAPGSEIPLPPDRAPPRVATVTLENGAVRLDVDSSVELYARGRPVKSLEWRSDADDQPDELTIGSLMLELIRRGADLAIRVRDSQSAARLSFAGIPYYPIDPDWRIVARLDRFVAEREVVFDDGDRRPQLYVSPGTAVFEKAGVTCRLLPVLESDRARMFVLFADPTNRDETYGAGRFLYAPIPEDGHIVLDFNKAFNPPCAFSPYAVCPLPPPENRLPLRVEAGEKRPMD